MLEMMIDLETLDTGPRSVVLSVGAVLFDERSSRTFSHFYRAIKLDRQLALGRTVSESTLLWWMEQNPSAQGMAFSEVRAHPHAVIDDLAVYASEVEKVWANSPDFDCTIWESLCRDLKLEAPWMYNQKRDLRTLREESGMPYNWKSSVDYTEHDPVDDCKFQIEVVREARRSIGL